MPLYHYFLHVFGGGTLMLLGYHIGFKEAQESNKGIENSKVVEFESEE